MSAPSGSAAAAGRQRLLWPLLGLGLLLLFNAVFSEGFFGVRLVEGHLYGNPVSILVQASKIMLVALGMTLVIATGGVDLSVGSTMAVSGSVAAVLAGSGHSAGVALAAALAAGAAIGLANGTLVSAVRIQPIVATLIFMVLGRGVAMLVTRGQPRPITDPVLLFLGSGHVGPLPVPPLLVLLAFGTAVLATRRTALGLFISAVGDNETAARLSGLHAARIQLLVYVVSGLCAALAGIMAAGRIERADAARLGELLELDAIFAVVVGGAALTGGKFSFTGSMIGALLIQTLTLTMINQGMPPEITPAPKALVILAVCLLQSAAFRRQLLAPFARRPAPSSAARP